MDRVIVAPGTDVSQVIDENNVSVVGGGLTRIKDGRVLATFAGPLFVDEQRCWVGETHKRNTPMEGDVVIGTIVEAGGETYSVDIGAPRLASLDALAFDGASKRNSPNLQPGALIFARVTKSAVDMEPQITCEATGSGKKKDWTTGESQFGELKGGCVFTVRRSSCRRLSETNNPVLTSIGKHVPFEVCIGFNGKVWVNAENPQHVVLIGAILKASEKKNLDKAGADTLVRQLLSALASISS